MGGTSLSNPAANFYGIASSSISNVLSHACYLNSKFKCTVPNPTLNSSKDTAKVCYLMEYTFE
ncbi:hypothetical protein GQ55_7G251500 [Panicum hallii var. hallii]|uniref:Uncharacterized protein n=1 Tax=Panicum hallii var. hallii TaxID=1504633 RepID=A0A2T7CYV4_9POAL|nr:hypothetical protein GQ55_7G251500 [Panicum hallii var. hallii]